MLIRVGAAEVGGLIEFVEWRPEPPTWPGPRSPGSTSAAAGGSAARPDGRTRVELRYAYGVAGAGITGLLAERVAAPTLSRHLRRSLHQLKREVEHEQLRAEARRRREAASPA